jgi:TRAP-type C4-dicarboxylate transport system substrate-binding protein
MEAALEAGEYKNELTREQEEEVARKLRDEGVTFVEVDRSAISRTMQPLYDNWEDQYGAEIRNKVEDFKASY